MEQKLEQLETKLDNLEKTLDKVLHYLNSDPLTKRKGLVEEIDELKQTLSNLLTREKVYQAKASVWGMVGALVVTALYKAIYLLWTILK